MSSSGAGGIHSHSSNVTILDSYFASNKFTRNSTPEQNEEFAREIFSRSPAKITVLASRLDHFEDAQSALIVPGVRAGVMRGSCYDDGQTPLKL